MEQGDRNNTPKVLVLWQSGSKSRKSVIGICKLSFDDDCDDFANIYCAEPTPSICPNNTMYNYCSLFPRGQS